MRHLSCHVVNMGRLFNLLTGPLDVLTLSPKWFNVDMSINQSLKNQGSSSFRMNILLKAKLAILQRAI